MIRLPAKFESQIIEYAKRLDSESESGASLLRSQVDVVLMTLKPNQRRSAKILLNKLVARIEGVDLAGHGKDLSRVQTNLISQ